MGRKRTFADKPKELPTAALAGKAIDNNQAVVGKFLYEKVCFVPEIGPPDATDAALAVQRGSNLPMEIKGQHSACIVRLSFVTDSEFPDASNNQARSMPELSTSIRVPAQVQKAEPSADFSAPKPKRIRTSPQNTK